MFMENGNVFHRFKSSVQGMFVFMTNGRGWHLPFLLRTAQSSIFNLRTYLLTACVLRKTMFGPCRLCTIQQKAFSLFYNYYKTDKKIIHGKHSRTLISPYISLADPGGGAHPARAPPNGRGPKIFYAQNANFSQIFLRSLRSRLILSILVIEIWPKHATI